jgi:hypothetical protein
MAFRASADVAPVAQRLVVISVSFEYVEIARPEVLPFGNVREGTNEARNLRSEPSPRNKQVHNSPPSGHRRLVTESGTHACACTALDERGSSAVPIAPTPPNVVQIRPLEWLFAPRRPRTTSKS